MGALADQITESYFYVADNRPVVVFINQKDAITFAKDFKGAEIYDNSTRVYLPTPQGLEYVRGGKRGETAYGKHIILSP